MAFEYRLAPDIGELLRLRIWRFGRPAPIWLELAPLVKEFIEKNKLQPISAEQLFDGSAGMLDAGARTGKEIIPRGDFPGGLRIAHLHMGRDIYRLDPKAWREFSGRALESVRQRLGSAQTVTFEQLMELSEATSTLG